MATAQIHYRDRDGIPRDHLGRMVCEHDDHLPASRCAQCKALILSLHKGAGLARIPDTHATPMPDWFRRTWHQLLDPDPQPTPEQDELEIDR